MNAFDGTGMHRVVDDVVEIAPLVLEQLVAA